MIHRHDKCIGITLWKWGHFQIELWCVPSMETIESHCHPSIDSTLIFLFGRMFGRIGERQGWVSNADCLRRFAIPAGIEHSATTAKFTAFLNIERWRAGSNVTSASVDFRVSKSRCDE